MVAGHSLMFLFMTEAAAKNMNMVLEIRQKSHKFQEFKTIFKLCEDEYSGANKERL